MRLFVALDIDPGIRQRIGEFRDEIAAVRSGVRSVGLETFHITLQFIGETNKLAEVRSALQQVRGRAIPLAFRGTDSFRTRKHRAYFGLASIRTNICNNWRMLSQRRCSQLASRKSRARSSHT